MPQLPTPSRILCRVTANNRRSILKLFADHIATDRGLHPVGVATQLMDPTTLQSTRLLDGALMLDGCLDGLDHPYFLVAHLAHPVHLNTTDAKPVDLITILVSPTNAAVTHLQLAARTARLLKDGDFNSIWRTAKTPDQLLRAYNDMVARMTPPAKQAAA